ncbi:MAG: hypothetical protein KGZ89_00935 [Actinobacteria bacterium]|nr:hypothetical protein [Actinomycetota bacterium]
MDFLKKVLKGAKSLEKKLDKLEDVVEKAAKQKKGSSSAKKILGKLKKKF